MLVEDSLLCYFLNNKIKIITVNTTRFIVLFAVKWLHVSTHILSSSDQKMDSKGLVEQSQTVITWIVGSFIQFFNRILVTVLNPANFV